MKIKIIILFLFFVSNIYSQSEVFYFKDSSSSLTLETIKEKKFKILKKQILEKHSNATYWFKIPAYNTSNKFVFRIKSIRADNAKAYQNSKELEALKNQRNKSFKFSRNNTLYVKVNSKFSAYFPFELEPLEASVYKEKLQLFINGFYYGLAFLVILFSLNYFYFFRDKSFLYHGFLLTSLTFSFVISDGIFNFFNVAQKNIEFLILLNYILLSYCSYKFVNSFLQIEHHFPKVKKFTKILVGLITLLVVLFLLVNNINVYILLNVLIFMLLFIYWFVSIFLFNKNSHTKLFVFAYAIILFSGLDFFVLRNFGFSILNSNSTNMKIGGLIQIITLSFTVLFREKNLRKYNFYMKNEIMKFSNEIKELTSESKMSVLKESIRDLSSREREIFDLIVLGKSNKQIAFEVNVSINTVKFHVKNIYGKLNIKNRKEAKGIENNIK